MMDEFHARENLTPINHSWMLLIPKMDVARDVEEFRPISLANYAYKNVSKVLANRIKRVIGDMVRHNSSCIPTGEVDIGLSGRSGGGDISPPEESGLQFDFRHSIGNFCFQAWRPGASRENSGDG